MRSFIKTKFKKGAQAILPLFAFVGMLHAQNLAPSKLIVTKILGKDTLAIVDFDEKKGFFEFQSTDLDYEYDLVVLTRYAKDSMASGSLVVPAKRKEINRYNFTNEKGNSCVFPLGLPTDKIPVFVCFGGNAYLEAYDAFIKKTVERFTDLDSSRLAEFLGAQIQDLIHFGQQFKDAQIVGYQVFNLQAQLTPALRKEIDPKIMKKHKNFLKGKKGFFYENMGKNEAAKSPKTCIVHKADTLVYDSGNSFIDPSLIKGNVHVLIFWATWCGPCKPFMKTLSDMNLQFYENSPVMFTAISSEDSFQKVSDFLQSHPEYKGLSGFHDDRRCMTTHYEINQYPTLLIFDKKGKLIARDPDREKIKEIIDKALAN